MTKRFRKRERGMAIALTLILLPVVLVLGFGLATLGIQNLNSADANRYGKTALFNAEAGAGQAQHQLAADTTWEAGFQNVETDTGTYSVEIFNNFDGNGPNSASNGAAVPDGTTYILSTGTAKDGAFERQVGVLVALDPGGSLFTYPVFGDDFVDISGSPETDSFDSRVGDYNATASNDNGQVGTNGTDSGDMNIQGSANVNGRVDVGSGLTQAEADAMVTGGGDHGDIGSLASPVPFPDVDIPNLPGSLDNDVNNTATLSSGTYGDVSLGNNETLTLTSGQYVFRSIDMSGQGSIEIDPGPVEIFIVGDGDPDTVDLDLTGGSALVNPSHAAPNCLIYAGEDASNVRLRGNSHAYYALYAPEAHVDISGTSDIFGSVMAKSVEVGGNGDVHYDRALEDLNNAPPLMTTQLWQRM